MKLNVRHNLTLNGRTATWEMLEDRRVKFSQFDADVDEDVKDALRKALKDHHGVCHVRYNTGGSECMVLKLKTSMMLLSEEAFKHYMKDISEIVIRTIVDEATERRKLAAQADTSAKETKPSRAKKRRDSTAVTPSPALAL